MGIYTTLRVSDGAPWFLEEHAARLGVAPARLRALLPSFDARVRVFADLFLQVERLRCPTAPWRLQPTDGDAFTTGALLKTTDRAFYDVARRRAQALDPGADDALLVGPDGLLRETTVANVFFVLEDGRLVTPPGDCGLLPGIARGWILGALGGVEQPVTLADAARARECFATNALMLAHPVTAIPGVATYPAGPTAERAAAACRRRCG